MIDTQRRNLLLGKNNSTTDSARLPWLKSSELFFENCSRCEKCISACPENIISKGDGGFPSVNFKTRGCNFCGECAKNCQESIFESDLAKKAWTYFAVVDQSCLSFQQISCRSCQDSCDYGAIHFMLQIGKISPPKIDQQRCTGCGACVAPCPSYAINISLN